MNTKLSTLKKRSLKHVKQLVESDLAKADDLIQAQLNSDVSLVNELSDYIINSGGKRIRPLLAILTARAFHYSGEDHILLAAVIEFLHTATLLHDDVVDESMLRRSRPTANAVWGNSASVLVGDFVYSRAFQMMVELNNMQILSTLADATNAIAEGEVLQLMNCHDANTTEARYFDVIQRKTARLFAVSAELGGLLAKTNQQNVQALHDYGMYLGSAFQLADDMMDYQSNSKDMGKNIGDDLAEGKPTLPLIYLLQHGTNDQKQLVRTAIEKGGLEFIEPIQQAIQNSDAIAYTLKAAQKQAQLAQQAISHLEESPFKDALLLLPELAIHRSQ